MLHKHPLLLDAKIWQFEDLSLKAKHHLYHTALNASQLTSSQPSQISSWVVIGVEFGNW